MSQLQNAVDRFHTNEAKVDKFVNGGIDEYISSTTGEKYPTQANAINQLLKGGGWRFFQTEHELLQWTPDTYPVVAYADNTKKLYQYDKKDNLLQWIPETKSGLGVAVDLINEKSSLFNKLIRNTSGVKLLKLTDKSNRVYLYVTTSGDIFMANLDGSLQENIVQLKRKTNLLQLFKNFNRNMYELCDSKGNKLLIIDKNADIYITGFKEPLQFKLSELDKLSNRILLSKKYKSYSYEIRDVKNNLLLYLDKNSELNITGIKGSVQQRLNQHHLTLNEDYNRGTECQIDATCIPEVMALYIGGKTIAPIPLNSIKTRLKVPDLLPLQVQQTAPLIVDTPYRKDDGVVHPCIAEFRDGFMGFRYIVGLTPYFQTQDKFENPCLYGTNNLKDLTLLTDQPITHRPMIEFEGQVTYNSDIFLTYDYSSGELLVCWRTSFENVNGRNELWCVGTRNGIDFTKPRLIYDGKILGGAVLSPSIIYNFETQEYNLFLVESTASGWRIRKLKSASLYANWEHVNYYNAPPEANVWHFEVKYIGSYIYAIAHDDSMTGSSSSKNFYLGKYNPITDDFSWGGKMLQGEHFEPYKASFVPVLNPAKTEIALQVMWSSRSGGESNMWKLYSETTQFLSLEI